MAVDLTKILLLGGIAVAGFFVYRKFAPQAAAGEMLADMDTAATEPPSPQEAAEVYQKAELTWAQRLQPEKLPSGNMLYQQLYPLPAPMTKYLAVVKHQQRSLNQLADESGRPKVSLSSDNPNAPHNIARVYFFNPEKGHEVAAWELKKRADLWFPDEEAALKKTFVHAFNYACKYNPRYDQFNNTLNTGVKEAGIPYLKSQCDVTYPVAL